MAKYRCTDVEYEDIYDFDYLRDQTPVPQRPGRTYTLDDKGEIEKPFRRPHIDSASGQRLPPAVVIKVGETGNPSGLPPVPPGRRRNADRASVCATQDAMVKRRFPTRAEARPASVLEQQRKIHTPEIEFRGDFDLRTHPAVQAYERQLHMSKVRASVLQSMETVDVCRASTTGTGPSKNSNPEIPNGSCRISLPDISHMVYPSEPMDTSNSSFRTSAAANCDDLMTEFRSHPSGSVFAERLRQYEDSIRPKCTYSNTESGHTGNRVRIGDQFCPAPPVTPKPKDMMSQRDFYRRRTRFQSFDVDADISCHKRSPLHNRLDSQPPPEVDVDFDAEIAEAVRVEKEMAALNRHLAEKQTKMSEYFRDMDIQKPSTAAAANCNLPDCTTPCFIPPEAVPVKTREPVRPWDGNSAKRKLGFRSKFKKEEPERKSGLSVDTIPERIRKQMKKYFT